MTIPKELEANELSLNPSKKEISEYDVASSTKSEFRTGSTFGACVNIVCVVAGTGTLGLPLTLNQGGWAALILFFLTPLVSIFTSRYLIQCLYYKEGERLSQFCDIGEAAFGKVARYMIKFFHYSISLSSPCIYILLSGLNIHQVIVQLNGSDILTKEAWIIISGVVVALPFCLMKTLKEVTILAVFGVLTTIIVIILVIVYGFIEFSSANYVPVHTEFIKWEGIPIALSTVAFSYGGNVVYPQVEATMKNPQNWNRAMIYSMLTITIMYVMIAIPGYLIYGPGVKSPVLDSLPEGAGSLASYFLITAHVLLAAPIYLCTFALDQEAWLKIDRVHMSAKKELLCRVAFRTSVTVVLTLIALFVPFFSDLMALIGSISSCLIVFVIPVICHYKLFGWRSRPNWHHFMCVFVIIIGLMGLVLGTISSVKTLVNHIQNGESDTVSH